MLCPCYDLARPVDELADFSGAFSGATFTFGVRDMPSGAQTTPPRDSTVKRALFPVSNFSFSLPIPSPLSSRTAARTPLQLSDLPTPILIRIFRLQPDSLLRLFSLSSGLQPIVLEAADEEIRLQLTRHVLSYERYTAANPDAAARCRKLSVGHPGTDISTAAILLPILVDRCPMVQEVEVAGVCGAAYEDRALLALRRLPWVRRIELRMPVRSMSRIVGTFPSPAHRHGRIGPPPSTHELALHANPHLSGHFISPYPRGSVTSFLASLTLDGICFHNPSDLADLLRHFPHLLSLSLDGIGGVSSVHLREAVTNIVPTIQYFVFYFQPPTDAHTSVVQQQLGWITQEVLAGLPNLTMCVRSFRFLREMLTSKRRLCIDGRALSLGACQHLPLRFPLRALQLSPVCHEDAPSVMLLLALAKGRGLRFATIGCPARRHQDTFDVRSRFFPCGLDLL